LELTEINSDYQLTNELRSHFRANVLPFKVTVVQG